MPEPTLLALDGVDTFYGEAQVHFDLSLHIRSGEIVCLLGGNASGKSTAMKVLLGLVSPRRGRVLWKGQDWSKTPTPQRIAAGLGSVPEARRLFPGLSVTENLLMGAYLRRDQREVTRDLAAFQAQIPLFRDRARQAAGTLSGGEQQLVALARALMGRPQIVLMDEPTMGLSPLWVERIGDLIRHFHAQGTAFFLVEQNLAQALSLADRGYVLQNGRMVREGTSSELRQDKGVQEAYLGAHE